MQEVFKGKLARGKYLIRGETSLSLGKVKCMDELDGIGWFRDS